ncbi:MAG: DUF1015 domain-containing protein [Treponemataceae bacterium]|nr:MAG: DUF1015 domain-containing protein [Treponemataceae bacterium]
MSAISAMFAEERFAEFGIHIPHILLPAPKRDGAVDLHSIDLQSWAVVACDQYTQDEAYWERAQNARSGKSSTLDLILPEIYLERENRTETQTRIAKIEQNMHEYLDGTGVYGNVFADAFSGMVYVERKTAFGRTRRGVVTAIDLDCYDWRNPEQALIRATEKTVPERLPPRMEVRRHAPLESPHIMLLVNDLAFIEAAATNRSEKLYSSELMQNSGSITGWKISEAAYPKMLESLEALACTECGGEGKHTMKENRVGKKPFLFAVGDGNHSLAAAKAVWDEYKHRNHLDVASTHPKRYALAEIVSLYDEGLTFEPIHRVLFGAKNATALPDFAGSYGSNIAGNCGNIAEIQDKIDAYLAAHPNVKIDYIHGADEVERMVREKDALPIFMPAIEKSTLFEQIKKAGALPRKSFSMGEACEKRFYIECRKISGD